MGADLCRAVHSILFCTVWKSQHSWPFCQLALSSLFESCCREDLSEEERSVLDGYEKGDTVDYLVNVGTCHEMGVEYEEVFSGRLASLMRGDCIRLRGDEGCDPVVVIHQYPVAGLGVKSPGQDSTKTDQLGDCAGHCLCCPHHRCHRGRRNSMPTPSFRTWPRRRRRRMPLPYRPRRKEGKQGDKCQGPRHN